MEQRLKQLSKWQKAIIIALPFLIVIVFLFWKCRYGFGNIDEGFYLSTAYRLFQGDALIKNEWNTTQLSYFLLYPFVSLFMRITGSTEGIIYVFRCLYTVLHSAVSVFLFFRLKKYHTLGALVASLCFMMFAPFGVMALSYNSMGIDALAVCFLTLNFGKTRLPFQWAVSGVFLAFSVLCCPFLIVLYFLFALATLVINVIPPLSEKTNQFPPKKLLFLTIGAAAVAAVFLAFLLSRCSFSDIIANIPNILGDPNHRIGFYKIVISFFDGILWSNGRYSVIALICYLILFAVIVFDRKRSAHKTVYLILLSTVTLFLSLSYLILNPYINFLLFPISLMGFFMVFLSGSSSVKKLFFGFWLPGVIASYCFNIGSDQGFYVISALCVLCAVSSLMMISLLVSETVENSSCRKKEKRVLTVLFVLLSLFQVFSGLYMRYSSVFWEGPMSEQKYRIENGCEKNLCVSEDKYLTYSALYPDMEKINRDSSIDSVFFLKGSSLFYLDCWKKRNASYSSSSFSLSEDFEYSLCKTYYRNNPDKMPDLVYYINWPLNLMDWNVNDFNRYASDIFPDYLRKDAANGIQLISPARSAD